VKCPLCLYGTGGVQIGQCGYHNHESYVESGYDPSCPWLGKISEWDDIKRQQAVNTRGPSIRPNPYPLPRELP
jgi:hypothetical protein